MYHFTCTLNSQGWSLKNNFKFDLKNILMIFFTGFGGTTFHDKEMLCRQRNWHSLQNRSKDIATGINLILKNQTIC